MKRLVSIATASVVLLAACAQCPPIPSAASRLLNGFDPAFFARPNPHQPNVFVVGNKIVLDQEPILISDTYEKQVTIAWALPAGSNYTFPTSTATGADDTLGNAAISVKKNSDTISNFTCKTNENGAKSVTCSYTINAPGPVKYTIKVNVPGHKDPLGLDPFFDNW